LLEFCPKPKKGEHIFYAKIFLRQIWYPKFSTPIFLCQKTILRQKAFWHKKRERSFWHKNFFCWRKKSFAVQKAFCVKKKILE